ncbi:MAG: hypothetical protein WC551_09470 [Patescibacteria group bacterium]
MPLSDEFVAEINASAQSAEFGLDEKAEKAGEPSEKKVEEEKPSGDGKQVEPEQIAGEPSESADKEVEEGKEKVGEEAVVVEKEEEEPKSISDSTLTRAIRAGLELSQARQFPTEESLLHAVSAIENAAMAREEGKKEQTKQEEPNILDSLPKLDPEEFEPAVIEMFDKLTGAIREQQKVISEFRDQHKATLRSSQETAAREVEQWFDKKVEELGDEFSDALGKGSYGSLDRGGKAFATRDSIASQMAVLLAGYTAAGQSTPPREKVFDAAVRLVLGDEYQKIGERKLTAELAKRSKQHIQRASGQKGNKIAQSPEAETAELLDKKFFAK